MNQTTSRIIVALDGIDAGSAMAAAMRLKSRVWGFKVNDLLLQEGVRIVDQLKDMDTRVFADVKFHDIPQTIENGVWRLIDAGADFVSVHLSVGPESLKRLLFDVDGRLKLLGITILTSMSDQECQKVYGDHCWGKVMEFACMAKSIGMDGMVCSAKEIERFAAIQDRAPAVDFRSLLRVVPGIRPAGFTLEQDDQTRIGTPSQAIRHGADYLVIGRPIIRASDPVAATEAINEEIGLALEQR